MLKILSLIVTVCVLLLGLALGVLNPTLVKFDAFFAIIELPLSVLLALTLVLGALLGALIVFAQVLKMRWLLKAQVRKNQKQADQLVQLSKEITQYKVGQKSLATSQNLTLN